MERKTIGKVVVTAAIENLDDLNEVRKGQRKQEDVRRIEVMEALVDTGASSLGVPKQLLAQLGLIPFVQKNVRTVSGNVTSQLYSTVRLTIQGRQCHCDVAELPDSIPLLVGQIPLEQMAWVVDPKVQKLIGNPEHGGEQMFDFFPEI
jgi:predicted aspartyl protease